MGVSMNLMFKNWQNKGNISYVYNLLLLAIVMESAIQLGKPGNICHNFHFFLPGFSFMYTDNSQGSSNMEKTIFTLYS